MHTFCGSQVEAPSISCCHLLDSKSWVKLAPFKDSLFKGGYLRNLSFGLCLIRTVFSDIYLSMFYVALVEMYESKDENLTTFTICWLLIVPDKVLLHHGSESDFSGAASRKLGLEVSGYARII